MLLCDAMSSILPHLMRWSTRIDQSTISRWSISRTHIQERIHGKEEKHIQNRSIHIIHCTNNNSIELQHVGLQNNHADVLTKPLLPMKNAKAHYQNNIIPLKYTHSSKFKSTEFLIKWGWYGPEFGRLWGAFLNGWLPKMLKMISLIVIYN